MFYFAVYGELRTVFGGYGEQEEGEVIILYSRLLLLIWRSIARSVKILCEKPFKRFGSEQDFCKLALFPEKVPPLINL